MYFDKKITRNLIEFILVLAVFVIPPILSTKDFIEPPPPQGFFGILIFASKILFLAAYEEVLYRIYLPYRIKSFYSQNQKKFKSYFFISEILPIIFFAAAHRYLGFFNIFYAFIAGIIFRSLYVLLKRKTSYVWAAICLILIHTAHNGIVYVLIFTE